MKVQDLTRVQMTELKMNYLVMERQLDLSYDDFDEIDALMTDAEMLDFYGDVDFVEEDFWCNVACAC